MSLYQNNSKLIDHKTFDNHIIYKHRKHYKYLGILSNCFKEKYYIHVKVHKYITNNVLQKIINTKDQQLTVEWADCNILFVL